MNYPDVAVVISVRNLLTEHYRIVITTGRTRPASRSGHCVCTVSSKSETWRAFGLFLENRGGKPRELFLVNLERCRRARFDFSHFSKLSCTTFSHHSSREDAMGDQTVSNLSLSLSNEVIELVDANGLARDALARAHSHANPRPRNRPVKKENARLRK